MADTAVKQNGDVPASASCSKAKRAVDKLGLQLVHLNKLTRDVFQGITFGRNKDETMEDRVKGVREFKVKAGDILLCGYPKCGNHWLIRILLMLVHKTTDLELGVSFDYFLLDLQQLDLLSDLDPPRVFATHFPFDMLPESVKDGCTKIVHVYRNPKAAFVSMFHMIKAMLASEFTILKLKGTGSTPEDFQKDFDKYLDGSKEQYGGCFSHMEKVEQFKKDNPQVPIIHIAYEDLLQDTVGCLRTLSDFLGVEASDALCSDVADAVSFKRQKEEEEKACPRDTITITNKIYRKGTADDWKNYLTVAQNEMFDAKLREFAHIAPMFDRYITQHTDKN